MTTKRIYRVELGWENDMRVNVPSMSVIDQETVHQFSGLLDQNGNRLMVVVKTEPAGFVVFPQKD